MAYKKTPGGILAPDNTIYTGQVDTLERLFSDLDDYDEQQRTSRKTVVKRRKIGAPLVDLTTAVDYDDEQLMSAMNEICLIDDQMDAGLTEGEMQEAMAAYANTTKRYNTMIDSLFAGDLARPRDFAIDDSHLPRADNIYEFMTGEIYLRETPFIAQILILLMLFEDYCPDCSDTRIFDEYDVGDSHDTVLDSLVLLECGKCPHCGKTRSDFFKEGSQRFYHELVLLLGQRAGKSYLTGACGAYITHYYLKLGNPHALLNVGDSTQLIGSCVATKIAQGLEALFAPMRSYLTSRIWFQEYTALLDEHKKRSGRDLYSIREHLFRFHNKNLTMRLEAANQSALRGRTRIFGAIDEIGHMTIDGGVQSGPLVWDAVDRSLLTVRGAAEVALRNGNYDVLNAIQFTVSSPRSRRDTINMKYNESKRSERMLGLQRATWEVNPTLPRSMFNDAFARNPVQALCDYGAQAPAASDPFIPNPNQIMESFGNKKLKNLPFKTEVVTMNGVTYTTATLLNPRGKTGDPVANWKVKPYQYTSLFSFDAGYTNNSFALSVFSFIPAVDNPDAYEKTLVGMYEIMPVDHCPLNYAMIFRDFVIPLAKVFNCRFAGADRWQSIKFLQDMELEIEGMRHSMYSLKMGDFVNLVSMLYSGDVVLPPMPLTTDGEPYTFKTLLDTDTTMYPACFAGRTVEHFYFQCATVRNTGKNVDKGEGLTDDLFRSFMVGLYLLDSDEVQDALFSGVETLTNTQERRPFVGSLGAGGSSGSAGFTAVSQTASGAQRGFFVSSLFR